MPFEQQLVLGVILPAVVAMLVMAVGVWRRRAWAGALGLTSGYIAAHLFIRGIPPLSPIDIVDWLPFLALISLIVGFVEIFANVPRFGRWVIGLATTVAMVYLVTRPMLANVWERSEAFAWLAGLMVGIAAIWWAVDHTVSREPGPIVPLVLGMLTAALAVVQVKSYSILLARLSGAAAITIAPLALVAWRWPREGLVRGALPVILVLFYGTLMVGFFYSGVSRGSALVLALSPLAAVFSRIGKRRWIGVLLAVAVAVSCVGASLGIAVATATPEPAADESY